MTRLEFLKDALFKNTPLFGRPMTIVEGRDNLGRSICIPCNSLTEAKYKLPLLQEYLVTVGEKEDVYIFEPEE